MRGLRPAMFGLVMRQIRRRPTRSVLTIAGVGVAMFLFVCVQTLQSAVARATQTAAQDTTLIVYRENRFCPATSRLPEHYQEIILQRFADSLSFPEIAVERGQSLEAVKSLFRRAMSALREQMGEVENDSETI